MMAHYKFLSSKISMPNEMDREYNGCKGCEGCHGCRFNGELDVHMRENEVKGGT